MGPNELVEPPPKADVGVEVFPKPVEVPLPNIPVPVPPPNAGLLWPKRLLDVPEPLPNPVDEPPNPPNPPDVEVVPPKRLPPVVVVVEPKPVLFWLKGDALEEPNPPEPKVPAVPPKRPPPVLVLLPKPLPVAPKPPDGLTQVRILPFEGR